MRVAGTKTKIAVGAFALLVVLVAVLGVFLAGDGLEGMKERRSFMVVFRDASGLQDGAPVKIGGVTIGRVTGIHLDFVGNTTQAVAHLEVLDPHFRLVRTDTKVQLQTQGVLGDKYAALVGGTPDAQLAKDGDIIPSAEQLSFDDVTVHANNILNSVEAILKDVNRFTASLPSGDRIEHALDDLAATTTSLRTAASAVPAFGQRVDTLMGSVDAIMGRADAIMVKAEGAAAAVETAAHKIADGQGTLGLLVNDPSLYDDARALLGRSNRNRVARGLVREALRNVDAPAVAAPVH